MIDFSMFNKIEFWWVFLILFLISSRDSYSILLGIILLLLLVYAIIVV